MTLRGYNGSIGLLLSRSAGAEDPGSGRVYPAAKWNIPLFIGKDATAPAGTGFLAQGSTNVASAAQNFMKVTDNWVNGINMSDATFSGVPLRILSFVVTSSSSVGIGTTSPRTQLSIHGTGGQTTAAFTNSGSRAGALLLNETNTLPGSGGAVLFGGTNSASWFGGIKGLLTSGDNSSQGRCGILNAECGDRCRSDRTDAHYGWRQHRYCTTTPSRSEVGAISSPLHRECQLDSPFALRRLHRWPVHHLSASTSDRLDIRRGSGTLAETLMSIASSGNVGIGTTTSGQSWTSKPHLPERHDSSLCASPMQEENPQINFAVNAAGSSFSM